MIDKIKVLYQQYASQIMVWYDGLDFFYQCGVLFVLIMCGLILVAFFILSQFTK